MFWMWYFNAGEFAVLPAQEVPRTIRRPAYAIAADGRPLPPGSASHSCAEPFVDSDPKGWSIDPAGEVQSHEALERMRKVCKLAATALMIAMNASKPGSAVAVGAVLKRSSLGLIKLKQKCRSYLVVSTAASALPSLRVILSKAANTYAEPSGT